MADREYIASLREGVQRAAVARRTAQLQWDRYWANPSWTFDHHTRAETLNVIRADLEAAETDYNAYSAELAELTKRPLN